MLDILAKEKDGQKNIQDLQTDIIKTHHSIMKCMIIVALVSTVGMIGIAIWTYDIGKLLCLLGVAISSIVGTIILSSHSVSMFDRNKDGLL